MGNSGANGEWLTIKLNKIEFNSLPSSTVTFFFLNQTFPRGLPLAPYKYNTNRDSEGDNEYSESAVSPAKVCLVIEKVGDLGAGENSSNSRGIMETEHNKPVFQGGHIGQHNSNNVVHADMADPIEGITSGVSFDVVGDGFQDLANHGDNHHQDKTLTSSPDVNNLGDGQANNSADDPGNKTGCGEKTMPAKR